MSPRASMAAISVRSPDSASVGIMSTATMWYCRSGRSCRILA